MILHSLIRMARSPSLERGVANSEKQLKVHHVVYDNFEVGRVGRVVP